MMMIMIITLVSLGNVDPTATLYELLSKLIQ